MMKMFLLAQQAFPQASGTKSDFPKSVTAGQGLVLDELCCERLTPKKGSRSLDFRNGPCQIFVSVCLPKVTPLSKLFWTALVL